VTSTALIEHLLLGLTVVFGLMAFLARLVRRGRAGLLRGGRRAPAIETLARVSLSKATSVAVLRVGERELLVGVGTGTVSLLAETPVGVLTGTSPMTIDVRDPEAAPALPAGRSLATSGVLARSGATSAQAGGAARPGVGVGGPWWPTFVEQLRTRTARTTRAHQQ
jgi:flagellar biosynthetic protein FliO